MKKVTALLMGLVFIIAGCKEKVEPVDIAAETEQVKIVLEKLITASEAEDIEMVGEIYSRNPDMVCIGTAEGERIVGWEKLKEIHVQQFGETDPVGAEVSEQMIKVHGSGQVAWFSEVIDWTLKAGEEEINFNGLRATGVLEKQNGKWVFVQIHYSVPTK